MGVAGDMTAGGAGEVVAGPAGGVLSGELALEAVVVGGVVEAGVGGSGGDVARGGGQFSREAANNFRSCDSA